MKRGAEGCEWGVQGHGCGWTDREVRRGVIGQRQHVGRPGRRSDITLIPID